MASLSGFLGAVGAASQKAINKYPECLEFMKRPGSSLEFLRISYEFPQRPKEIFTKSREILGDLRNSEERDSFPPRAGVGAVAVVAVVVVVGVMVVVVMIVVLVVAVYLVVVAVVVVVVVVVMVVVVVVVVVMVVVVV